MSQKRAAIVLAVGLVVMFTNACVIARILHVNPSDPSAYSSVQEAIDKTSHFDTVVVHPGTYQENIDFRGRAITVTSTDPNDPGVVAGTIIDGGGSNVVTFSHGETAFTKLLGISVRNGAHGIYCDSYDCKPQITNCVVSDNSDDGFFGGLPSLVGCVIRDNRGDGIDSCSESIRQCTITGNRRNGIRNHYGDLTDSTISGNELDGVSCDWAAQVNITGCTISNNGEFGILLRNSGPNAAVAHTIISGNSTDGLSCIGTTAAMTNCTVIGNGENGLIGDNTSKMTVANCIIVWNAEAGISAGATGVVTSRYNNLYGNDEENYVNTDAGQGDIRENPWFAGNGFWEGDVWQDGDYHLLSTLGRWDPAIQGWMTDPIGSPCLDKGDPEMLFGQEPYPHGGRLNLGAYGGTVEASKSEGTKPVCKAYPEMDFNKDCKVDQADLDIFMEQWLVCNLDPNDACWGN